MVQLELGSGEATYAQHNWAARCAWTGHVFVANGSHASYPSAGEHGRPWPDPDDEARGDGLVVRPEVRRFGSWVRWPPHPWPVYASAIFVGFLVAVLAARKLLAR